MGPSHVEIDEGGSNLSQIATGMIKHLGEGVNGRWRWIIGDKMPCQFGGDPACRCMMAGEKGEGTLSFFNPSLRVAFAEKSLGPRLMPVWPKPKVTIVRLAAADAAVRPTGEHVGEGRGIVRTIRTLWTEGIIGQNGVCEACAKRWDDLAKGGIRTKGIGVVVIHEHGRMPDGSQEQRLKAAKEMGPNDFALIGASQG